MGGGGGGGGEVDAICWTICDFKSPSNCLIVCMSSLIQPTITILYKQLVFISNYETLTNLPPLF